LHTVITPPSMSSHPSAPPCDDRDEPLAGGRELVPHRVAARRRLANDERTTFEHAEPLHEQRPAHLLHAAMDLVEPGRTDHELADHQWRPSIAQHLDGRGDRAVVGISRHTVIVAWASSAAVASCARLVHEHRNRVGDRLARP
jgi:hypothetical protein